MTTAANKLCLSISQIATFDRCEALWYYKYVAKLQPDYEDTSALIFGKVYHHFVQEGLDAPIPAEYDLDEETKGKIFACAKRSLEDWQRFNPKMLGNEIRLDVSNFTPDCDMLGFIDSVAEIGNKWYMVELKTASMESDKTRLVFDPQVSFYASQKDKVAEILNLDPKKFGGVIYREVIKPYKKIKKDEGYKEFAERIYKDIKISNFYVMPNEDFIYKFVHTAHERMKRLLIGVEPRRAYGRACMMFEKRCEYFSQCYGKCEKKSASVVPFQNIVEIEESDFI